MEGKGASSDSNTKEVAETPKTEPTETAAKKECEDCGELIPAKAKVCRFCGKSFTVQSTEENKSFTVTREEIMLKGHTGERTAMTRVMIKLKDQQIVSALQSYVREFQHSWDHEAPIPAKHLFDNLSELKRAQQYMPNNPLSSLIEFLEKEFQQQIKIYNEMIEAGVISFDGLSSYFQKGKKVVGLTNGYLVGGDIVLVKVLKSLFQTLFVIKISVIKTDGTKCFNTKHTFMIPYFDGLVKISELNVQLITPEVQKELSQRGELFRKYALGNHHLNYKGTMHFTDTSYWRHTVSWNADGRLVVDTKNFNKLNHNSNVFSPQNNDGDENVWEIVNLLQNSNTSMSPLGVADEDLWKTWPTLGAFTLVKKKWGEVFVGALTPVDYDVDAFAKLVFPPEKKELIRSFILHSEGMKNDVISGKGGGALFLLHGPPGCGKTLTAEAIAELLNRPLYKVDCGELTSAGLYQVESKLSQLLELAAQWNAVVLIDEADIFLEKRTTTQIDRNAVVGTFLRVLEYYNGVLFLTTNRVHDFDEAFYSRIQVKLKYYELDENARCQVWSNFLQHDKSLDAQVSKEDISELAKTPMNGREIRNVIQLAKALARGENSPLTKKHISSVIALYTQFDKEMKEVVDTQQTKEINELKRSVELKRSLGLN